ncbi:MAG: gliding motility-associated C-terminal domain-containing protein [Bacteroidales bacterium]|jgi:gliding motility-associated-like protein|nr:gliding motility-associated C-terminal domain-containing protein [Bacteroidales bacterium]
MAQSKIGGTINKYTKVTSLSTVNNRSVLQVSDASDFGKHDTVLLIQMTGVDSTRNIPGHAGKYEFHIVSSVVSNVITLMVPATFHPEKELVQLIRVPSRKKAEVTSELTCKPWDYQRGTGGVVAVMVEETLTIAANIDVSGKGFRGGQVTPPTSVLLCPPPTTSEGYPASAYLIAGNKGEGFLKKSTYANYPRGRLFHASASEGSGGGGGYGAFAGGGGGGNGGNGGNGGLSVCGIPPNYPIAQGGKEMVNNSGYANRIFMGGGGGTGTGNGTAGGNGGGIVMLIAKTIAFKNNAKIAANGESVSGETADGGAGGGGAGGSVLLIADQFEGVTSIELNGGKGGNTEGSNTGTGGGGGGGLLSVKQAAVPNVIQRNTAQLGGNRGDRENTDMQNAATRGTGTDILLVNHKLQQKGFLYNFILSNDTVFCDGDSKILRASEPQGILPAPAPVYQWLRKTGGHGNWEHAPGVANSQHYTTASISDTVFYKRVVIASQEIDGNVLEVKDTSSFVQLIAIPAIKDNTLITQADTTLCENVSNWLIRGLNASAAKGAISYQWQQFNNAEWTDIHGEQNCDAPATPSDTLLYHRIVKNWYAPAAITCTDTSNKIKVSIIPRIENNVLIANQNLCETEHPVSLQNGEVNGGDGIYTYQWQSSETGVEWHSLPDITEDLQPEEGYTGERHYIRIVHSGPCTSSSPATVVRFDKTPSDAVITSPAMDTALYFKFNTIVEAAPISDGIGTWTIEGTGSLSDTDAPNSKTITGLDLGSSATVTWTVSSDNGYCPDKSDQVSVMVKDVTIPSGFSPNNDQINDCFGVLGSNHAEHIDLVIINRNNKIVFRTSSLVSGYPYPCLWEGKDASGNDLPTGTYFYRLTLTGGNQKQYLKTGYVTLKK